MSVVSRRLDLDAKPLCVGQATADLAPVRQSLSLHLLRGGVVEPDDMLQALALRGRLTDSLLARRRVPDPLLYDALARHWSLGQVDLATEKPDARLIDQWGAVACLADGLVPWRRLGDVVMIATPDPETFDRHRARLTSVFGPIAPALSPPRQIEAAILAIRGPALALAAEETVPTAESCRNWSSASSGRLALGCLTLAGTVAIWPQTMLTALLVWALITLIAAMGMKSAALWLAMRPARPDPKPAPIVARLPMVSIIVALYREADIAARLVRRLSKLDYPHGLLDIVLAVEAADHMTRNALAKADLPPWMRIVVAPEGRVKTKPRALNFALGLCRGSIVGVYDAEDAPEPDQIRRVVDQFSRRGPDVACLQGVLDFYNPGTNWLSRCFTIEYASWFRVVLPGIQRMGFPIPLGGTTLFFRRAALEKLGGWDACNVTEDADLGLRLARHGYRTEMVATTTYEEANCRAVPWVKQRSRWIKGFMMTYATHMREPLLLWRQLGTRQFIGFQVLFLGSLSQVLLVPLLWSLWAVVLGFSHPLTQTLTVPAMTAMTLLFITSEALTIAAGMVGLRRSGQKISLLWVPTLHFYHPMAALASYKALWEMIDKPFYWDKTSHGHFDQPG